jgi:predicted nucleic acid-binding protein
MARLTLLDSTVLVDHLRGSDAARAYLAGLTDVPSCSELTRVEVLRGLRTGERRVAERLLAMLRWVPVDEPIARRAGELGRRYRRSHRTISTADLVIAASAEIVGGDLATTNVRHFPMFEELQPPY